jgi:hypothetical protein
MGSRNFSEWNDAVEWAKETDRELVPIGTALGTDVVAVWENEKSRLELQADYCEYIAEGETAVRDTHCVVKCYKIVVWKEKTAHYELDDSESRDDAFEDFEKWKELLTQ